MRNQVDLEQYGEFKGTTDTKLGIIFTEIKELRKDVNALNQWKSWTMGASAVLGAVGGFIVGIIKDYIHFKV